MRSPLVIVLPLLALACGGATTSDLFNDASAGNDASTGKDASTGDGSNKPDSRADVAPPADCKRLINDVANARDKARECLPSGLNQCGKEVQDLCCPISVTDPSRKEVLEFIATVDAVKKAGCLVACPDIVCPPAPSNKCDAQTAHCQ